MTSLLTDIDRLCALLSQAAETINNTNNTELLTTQLYTHKSSPFILQRKQIEEGLITMTNNANNENIHVPVSLLEYDDNSL